MYKYSKESDELLNLINKSETIGLAGHVSPDADAIGSCLALTLALRTLNKKAHAYKVDELPKYLSFLDLEDKFTEIDRDEKVDLFIVLDSSTLDRIGEAQEIFNTAKYTVVIDHHKSNLSFAKVNIIDSSASSTCEMVSNILLNMNIKINEEIASLLFTGIITDTNRFLYSSAGSETLKIASILMDKGIDTQKILQALYQMNTLSSQKLTSEVISNAKFYYDNRMAMSVVTKEMLNKVGASQDDIEDKINLIRDIDTVELAILIKEISNDEFKVSLRSKKYVDVSNIALSFNGGGHLRAAGFSYFGNLNNLISLLESKVEEIEWQ